MVQRGRPAKILSQSDLEQLLNFLKTLPFLKKHQQQALQLLQQVDKNFNDQQLNILKTADRQRIQYQQRQVLLEQLQLKASNQQKLLENEAEILALSGQDLDQDTFFRLDRALESYHKIHNAVLNDRIRLENEHRRDVLNKSRKTLTEAQIKRRSENKQKYELGLVLLKVLQNTESLERYSNLERLENFLTNAIDIRELLMETPFLQDFRMEIPVFEESLYALAVALTQLHQYSINGKRLDAELLNIMLDNQKNL